MARALAEQLGLADAVLEVSLAGGLRAVGRRVGRASSGGEESGAGRIAQLAEFVEVAHRVGGVEAAWRWPHDRSRQPVRPELAALVWTTERLILAG